MKRVAFGNVAEFLTRLVGRGAEVEQVGKLPPVGVEALRRAKPRPVANPAGSKLWRKATEGKL